MKFFVLFILCNLKYCVTFNRSKPEKIKRTTKLYTPKDRKLDVL